MSSQFDLLQEQTGFADAYSAQSDFSFAPSQSFGNPVGAVSGFESFAYSAGSALLRAGIDKTVYQPERQAALRLQALGENGYYVEGVPQGGGVAKPIPLAVILMIGAVIFFAAKG